MTYAPTWRATAPDDQLDYRCDLCGAPADTLHFLPYITSCEAVLFACPDHDPGGYWTRISRLAGGALYEHLMGYHGIEQALGLLGERQDAIRRQMAERVGEP